MSELDENPKFGSKPRWEKALDRPEPTKAVYLTPQAIRNLKHVLAFVTEYESLTLSEAVVKLCEDHILLDNYRTRRENQDKDRGMTVAAPEPEIDVKDKQCSYGEIHGPHEWDDDTENDGIWKRWCKGRKTRFNFTSVHE